MSHFTVLVVTSHRNLLPQERFEEIVQNLLDPYFEGVEVPEYDEQCYCIGILAIKDINTQSDKQFGSWEDLRSQFNNKISPPPKNATDQESEIYFLNRDKLWIEFVKDKSEFEKSKLQSHPLKNSSDPNCTECKGSGFYKSTRNPKSKWDWYQIGGRWDGECHKDGLNIFKVNELSNQTFAIVTPDGEWHERGKMGWWAVVSDENDNWEEEYKKIIEPYGENYAVLVDCHI